MSRPGFFAELKRRNVLRAAVLYAGAVWALALDPSNVEALVDLANADAMSDRISQAEANSSMRSKSIPAMWTHI